MKRRKSRTNFNGSSGRPKNKSLESVDRISFLPDSILGIILSFLPTKNAVSTAVLSKRWKLVWTTVHNLDLCYEDSLGKQDERDDMRFVGFVNRVLLHHDAGWLNKFRLVWTPRCISSHATSWISTAISKNVHELFLRLETNTLVKNRFALYLARTSPEPFVMPICVFNCTMLRFLELDGGISVSESIVVCLPKLETIKLVSVYFQSEEAFEKLIRGCPVLINLIIMTPYGMLNEFFQDDGFTCIISSTSLRRLEIRHEYETDRDLLTNLKLEASSLEYLTLYGVIPAFLVQKSLSSLVEAKFDIDLDESYFDDADICNSVVEAVRMLDCAKALILSVSTIWALSCATISLSTEFKRLVKLETETYCCACSSLRDFIQCSDNLEVLRIHQVPECVDNEYDHDHSNWTTPVEVPRCLSTSLKKVVLDNYYGNEDEREMIRYMLLHGSALEVMQISCDTRFEGPKLVKLELVQEICEFSRKLSSKFPACEAKFHGGHQSATTSRCCNHHSAIEFYWSLLNHNESQVWMKGMDVLG